jgi:GLPGLI family protein
MITYKKELPGKTYIIKDSVKIAPWKFGPETKTVAGYTCKVAFYTDNSNPEKPLEYTAWYTDKIRPFVGPENFNTLPGGVLALDINAGEHYWVATKIELRDLKPTEEIKIPEDKKATVTTMEEYKVLEAENEKRMAERGMRGGR